MYVCVCVCVCLCLCVCDFILVNHTIKSEQHLVTI